jgi:dTDP-4-dehydrorhamnose 3,5-epimerase
VIGVPTRLIKINRHQDDRGWFAESYNQGTFARAGLDVTFVQDNHSYSRHAGTLRGLHLQLPPDAQAKLVRCVRGRIWDVAVDLRAGSPSYGGWVAAELSADNFHQLYIPVGFAHGFVTLEPDTEVEYKVSALYAARSEIGLAWDDPDLALPWPLPAGGPILSPKDQALPRLADFQSPFDYDGVPMRQLDV